MTPNVNGSHDSDAALTDTTPASVLVPLDPDLELLVKLDRAVLDQVSRLALVLSLDWDTQLAQIKQTPEARVRS